MTHRPIVYSAHRHAFIVRLPTTKLRELCAVRSFERSYRTSGPVTTGIGDRLRAGIPSRAAISQLGQLSLASLRGRLIEYQLRLG